MYFCICQGANLSSHFRNMAKIQRKEQELLMGMPSFYYHDIMNTLLVDGNRNPTKFSNEFIFEQL